MQKTPPESFLIRLPVSAGPRDSPSLAGHGPVLIRVLQSGPLSGGRAPRARGPEIPQRGTLARQGPNEGLSRGPGGLGSLIRKHLGELSVFRKVRSELLRPILDLLDPVKHLRICFG